MPRSVKFEFAYGRYTFLYIVALMPSPALSYGVYRNRCLDTEQL